MNQLLGARARVPLRMAQEPRPIVDEGMYVVSPVLFCLCTFLYPTLARSLPVRMLAASALRNGSLAACWKTPPPVKLAEAHTCRERFEERVLSSLLEVLPSAR
jgi:hypothetical protein